MRSTSPHTEIVTLEALAARIPDGARIALPADYSRLRHGCRTRN